MSSLSFPEKSKLEKLLDMGSGYVSNFSDITFAAFFSDFDVDIHSERYTKNGTSKAKKLRQFWKIEPDHLVGQTLQALIKHIEDMDPTQEQKTYCLHARRSHTDWFLGQ
jgi:hypothetical protein